MILLAESGSTKTNWVLLKDGIVTGYFNSSGLNPYVQKKEEQELLFGREVLQNLTGKDISKVYFYGAGCSTVANCNQVKEVIQKFLPESQIFIEHDITAAAVGLFGDQKGIAAILGTGSNSCFYNGEKTIEGIPALGFILGDEGGGAWLGKRLLRDFMYLNLPSTLYLELVHAEKLSKELILNKVYKEEGANRWLASFAPFIKERLNEPYCREIVIEGFNDFFRYHIIQFEIHRSYPLRAVGSIAFNFNEILKEVASSHGFIVDKVLQSPLEGLIEYHSK